ncbi:MAG: hypothetical protein KIS68_12145 [Bauldia sp.]|nr:hypothetical protein [Bauldia sp.]
MAVVRVLSLVFILVLTGCATAPPASITPSAAAGTGGLTVLVAAVEGAPVDLTPTFTAAYTNAIASRGYAVVAAGASYNFRTYLSVVGSTAGTLLIYVTDVTNAIGVRVTRITGQASSSLVAADPWRVVADQLIGQAVTRTVEQFVAFLAGNAPGV